MDIYNNIDFDKLREDLINYVGTAINIIPIAQYDLLRIMNCRDEELLFIAKEFNFDLSNYFYNIDNYK